MKKPSSPRKPYTPFKPKPPEKRIVKKEKLGELSSQEDATMSLESLRAHMVENYPTINPNDITFSLEIDKDYGYYYDEVYTHVNILFERNSIIDNPLYDEQFAYYQQQLVQYKLEYKKYKTELKQYAIDEKAYQVALEKYQLEYAKQVVKKLEKKKVKGK